jgi:predicted amidohydrolase YtcJ
MVAVKDGRVLLVAGEEEAETVTGAGTKIIDCRGKSLLPGFNDAHCHLFSFLRKLLSVDLSSPSVKCIADIKAAINIQARRTAPGNWISGTDFNDFYLTERRYPTRRELDEVAPNHPVVLSHASLHTCVLNSQALSRAGITRDTEPEPGTLIERDPATGEPNGRLYEMLGYIREKVMPPLSEAELSGVLARASEHYLSRGITSLQEATIVNNLERWRILKRFQETGSLLPRLYMMFGSESLREFRNAGLTFGYGDSQLRLGGVKIIVTESTGRPYPEPVDLIKEVDYARRCGFPVAIHAAHEKSLAAVIDTLEFAGKHRPLSGQRHRIEHCIECPPFLLERLRRLAVIVVTQPPFIYYGGDKRLVTTPESQKPWLYRIKSLLDSGLTTAASSDSPIVPDNPLSGIYAAMTRRTKSGQLISADESISVGQALMMYTKNAAAASFEQDIKGSLSPGKLADMVVLSGDPLRLPPEEIKNIRVELTILGGKVVWEA